MVDIVNGSRSDEVIAGTIVLTVGITGISLNIAAILLIYRTPSLHNAFGFICSSHLLSNIGLLVVFSFWTAPMLLIGCSESITQSYIGQRMGQLVVLFWFATIYGHLQIALNRLVAIISPLLYSSTFTRIRTIQILVIFWFISFMQVAGQFFKGCTFTFHVDSFLWSYATTDCGYNLAFYLAFLHGTIFGVIVVMIDTTAFFAILKKAKKMAKTLGEVREASILKYNIRLYAMGCTQAFCFIWTILCFHFLPLMLTTKWSRFATLTVGWELVHAVDGLILIVFHEKFRVLLCHPSLPWRKNAVLTVATTRSRFLFATEDPHRERPRRIAHF
ncbi:hypothetical protein V3C99_003118 [Haemonchus contortus]